MSWGWRRELSAETESATAAGPGEAAVSEGAKFHTWSVANRNRKKATLPERKSQVRVGTNRKIHVIHYADLATERSPLGLPSAGCGHQQKQKEGQREAVTEA